jgi:adenylate cyclase
MEVNVAILMADLSGYSALTETHGSVTAVDLIDKYISVAENCLVGDCKLHQQTGDEIMFVSNSSDVMLATAKQLAANTAELENFLQVHGGLHYGPVLKRGSNYFGSTVNLTARIAAKAATGAFYCSSEFIDSITDKSTCLFQSRGNHSLKNICEEKDLFELSIDKTKVC